MYFGTKNFKSAPRIAHDQDNARRGGWHKDGQFAGYYNRRLEAYAMQILQQ